MPTVAGGTRADETYQGPYFDREAMWSMVVKGLIENRQNRDDLVSGF